MEDYQEAQVKMMQEVVSFFDLFPELEKNNPKLKEHVDIFRKILKDIEENAKDQSFDITGYTENKKKDKSDLANLIVNITSSICSFGTDTGKNELYNQFKTPISKVNAKSDAKIVTYSNTTIQEAGKYSKELEPYNVTAEELTELANLTKQYSAILLIPAQKRIDIAIATANIKKLIPKGLKTLKRSIDRDMEHYKDINVKAYNTYHRLRNIDDSKTSHLSVKGTVLHAATKEPVDECAVTIIRMEDGKEIILLQVETTELGNYRCPGGIEPGMVIMRFTCPGLLSLDKKLRIFKDKSVELNVELEKDENYVPPKDKKEEKKENTDKEDNTEEENE